MKILAHTTGRDHYNRRLRHEQKNTNPSYTGQSIYLQVRLDYFRKTDRFEKTVTTVKVVWFLIFFDKEV